MWKDLLQLVRDFLTLSKDLAQTKEDIKEIKKNLLDLTLAMQRIADQVTLNQVEIKHAKEQAQAAHENSTLQLQLKFIELERRLPPAPKDIGE